MNEVHAANVAPYSPEEQSESIGRVKKEIDLMDGIAHPHVPTSHWLQEEFAEIAKVMEDDQVQATGESQTPAKSQHGNKAGGGRNRVTTVQYTVKSTKYAPSLFTGLCSAKAKLAESDSASQQERE